jgi:hypothetical protein
MEARRDGRQALTSTTGISFCGPRSNRRLCAAQRVRTCRSIGKTWPRRSRAWKIRSPGAEVAHSPCSPAPAQARCLSGPGTAGPTPDCFNDVGGAPEPFVGPVRTAERYRKPLGGLSGLYGARPPYPVPTKPASSPRTSGAAPISARLWDGRRPESRCECARSRSGISGATRYGARRSFSISLAAEADRRRN